MNPNDVLKNTYIEPLYLNKEHKGTLGVIFTQGQKVNIKCLPSATQADKG